MNQLLPAADKALLLVVTLPFDCAAALALPEGPVEALQALAEQQPLVDHVTAVLSQNSLCSVLSCSVLVLW